MPMPDDLLPTMTPDVALQWITRGAFWALLIGLLDLVIWGVQGTTAPGSPFRSVQLVDGLFTLGLGAGVLFRSRVAASVLLTYWVYAKLHQLAVTVHVIGPLVGLLLFGWVFLNTARAAIALHGRAAPIASDDAPAT
jgi:hypothetical protein